MTVSNKVALGLDLLVALLAGALISQISLAKRLLGNTRELSAVQVETTELTADLEAVADQLTSNIRKYFATRDSVYRQEITRLQGQFLTHLRTLQLVMTSLRQEADRDTGWVSEWSELIDEVLRRTDDLEVRELPLEDLQAGIELLDETQQIRILQHLPRLEELEELGEQEHLALVEDLSAQVREIKSVTRAAIDQQIEQSRALSRRSERFAWTVALIAILLTLMIGFGLTRAINRPLKRLIAGTRAVAEGRFTYQLETRRNDEFAAVAASFNTMVQRLDELDQMKKDFVARVSHDLKAPLAAMQETQQLLLEEIPGPINAQQQRVLHLNLQSGQRLSMRISKLLDLSRMAAGGLELDRKRQDLAEMVRFVATEFAARFRAAEIELRMVLPPSAIALHCDRDRILQVIENLLENALKYSPPKSVIELAVSELDDPPPHLPPSWRRKLKAPRTWCWLSLCDQGPGVPDEHKEQIFHEFHQVDHARSHGGVGLGLAICREIVDAHGGAIWVTDDEGGSVFHLLLPAGEDPA